MQINTNYDNLEQSYLFSTIARKVREYSASHPEADIIRLGIGDVTRPLVPAVIDALHAAVEDQAKQETFHGYGDEQGYDFLHEALVGYYKTHGVELATNEIFISDGAKSDLGNILDIFGKDNVVLVPDPVYPVYVDTNVMAGRKIVFADANEANGFLPLPGASVKCDIIYICSPNNPTGVIYSEETLQKIAAILEKKQKEFGTSIVLLSDEPYRELAYDGAVVPYVTKYYRNTVVCYSYSKSLSLPGERIGYLVIPSEMDESANVFQAATIANRVLGCVNAPSLMQRVIKRCVDANVNLEAYDRNRNLLYNGLKECGFSCIKPEGAFYLFVKSPVENEKEFCEVCKQYNVLVVPGSSFACPGYVRIAYCVSYGQIERSLPAFRKIAEHYNLV